MNNTDSEIPVGYRIDEIPMFSIFNTDRSKPWFVLALEIQGSMTPNCEISGVKTVFESQELQ